MLGQAYLSSTKWAEMGRDDLVSRLAIQSRLNLLDPHTYKEMCFDPSTLWILNKKATNNTSLPSN